TTRFKIAAFAAGTTLVSIPFKFIAKFFVFTAKAAARFAKALAPSLPAIAGAKFAAAAATCKIFRFGLEFLFFL
ncbi:MAG TPA: hypothetical protein PLX33_07960, partial [Alphaproteobacteria bacterium]|nr:hypothetical protein [Alphaproteobacteria bacterium]